MKGERIMLGLKKELMPPRAEEWMLRDRIVTDFMRYMSPLLIAEKNEVSIQTVIRHLQDDRRTCDEAPTLEQVMAGNEKVNAIITKQKTNRLVTKKGGSKKPGETAKANRESGKNMTKTKRTIKTIEKKVRRTRDGVEKVGYGIFQYAPTSMSSEIVVMLEQGLSVTEIEDVLREQGKSFGKSTVSSIRSMWRHDKPLMEAKAKEANKKMEKNVKPEPEAPVIDLSSIDFLDLEVEAPSEPEVPAEPVATEKVEEPVIVEATEAVPPAEHIPELDVTVDIEVDEEVAYNEEDVAPSTDETARLRVGLIFSLYEEKIITQMEAYDLLKRV